VRSKASPLWIYDAFLQPDRSDNSATNEPGDELKPRPATYVRDGVGIDRGSGAASRTVKFDHEIIPSGTCFNLRLRLNSDSESETAEMLQLLAAGLVEWQEGRGQLGGNTARGMGRFSLQELTFKQTMLQSEDDLIDYLVEDDQSSLAQTKEDWPDRLLVEARKKRVERGHEGREKSIAASFLKVSFDLQTTDLFLANDPLTGLLSGFDHAPLVEFISDKKPGKPLLSGSSLRGVLRSRAEKISRTLATNHWVLANGTDWDQAREDFLDHCPACDVLVGNHSAPLASCDSRLQISDLHETAEEALCLSCRLFGNQRRGSRLWVKDARYKESVLDQKDWTAQDFVAIDRFTGGSLNQAKFDAAPLYKARFSGEIILHDPTRWELGLLTLLLRDLVENRLIVGFGGAKGYGRIGAGNLNWTVGFITTADLMEGEHILFPTIVADAPEDSGLYQLAEFKPAQNGWLPEGWQAAAQEWITAFKDTVITYENGRGLQALQEDTFLTADSRLLRQLGISRLEINSNE
jgi:CRISPR/Cas system CSM-associated protein Csm3 (group 7 of RAMP superfamily)